MLAPAPAAEQTRAPHDAFDAFWAADSPETAVRRVDPILKSGVSFDDAYRALRQGRPYLAQKTGLIRMMNSTAALPSR
jgi:hypothetical protein